MRLQRRGSRRRERRDRNGEVETGSEERRDQEGKDGGVDGA